MTIKQMLSLALILGSVGSSGLATEQLDLIKSEESTTFRLDSKHFPANSPANDTTKVAEKIFGKRFCKRCRYRIIPKEDIKQEIAANDGKLCTYCANSNTIILDTNHPNDCDGLLHQVILTTASQMILKMNL